MIVTFRRPEDLDELKKAASAKLVAADGASLEGFAVDVTDEAAVAKLIDGIVERYGRLDCLVNAVGGLLQAELSCGRWRRKFLNSRSR